MTELGWLMLIKGVVLMAMPPRLPIASYRLFLNTPQRFRILMVPAAIFGAWMTLVAFID